MKLKKTIINSLCYRAVFNYPLSFYQLSHYLIGCDNWDEEELSFNNLKHSLKNLVNENKINYVYGKYLLSSRSYVNWNEGVGFSEDLIKKAEKTTDILKRIPWIKFIGITGAVSAFGAQEDDDIDFLIVTQKNRLWLVRGFVFVILKILGQLRTDDRPERKICPNIFLSEEYLSWEKQGRNLFVANEICMLYPLYDKDEMYFRFIKENEWVFNYFINFKVNFDGLGEKNKNPSVFMKFLEKIAYILQKKYMKKRRTTELIQKNRIHFNKQDHTGKILLKYNNIKSSCHSNF